MRRYFVVRCDAVAHINIARRVIRFENSRLAAVRYRVAASAAPAHPAVYRIYKKCGRAVPAAPFHRWPLLFSESLEYFAWYAQRYATMEKPPAPRRWEPGRPAILYCANPNLIYIQATAMGESLYLALFIWAVVYFTEFTHGAAEPSRSLTKMRPCVWRRLASRDMTAWFLAALMAVVVVLVIARSVPPFRK